MATISAVLVKELRERTGSSMMECKKALEETAGDLEAAVDLMRKHGLAKADKKASRTAADGRIVLVQADSVAVLVEVNCETDFVAKGDEFQAFASAVAQSILSHAPRDLEAALALPLSDGKTIDEVRREKVAKIGENITVRRFYRTTTAGVPKGVLGCYLHSNHRIGVVVTVAGGSAELAKDIAMHIAASKPICVSGEQVPQEVLDKERDIYCAQAAESGKPAAIIEKMVEGRIRKYIAEVTLLGQPFVKDPDKTVGALLKADNAEVIAFERFELGEGIEKKTADFVAEVMAQAKAHE